mmetsp:Transcript_24111/g.43918  ORF Transcript_24111/g.43918 Transcript_24111/m.43918 type:complete len:227 (-) Transcript_24111:152-832(-)
MALSGKNKKAEVAAIRRELTGEKQIMLNRLSGDCGTDEGERRSQLIWQSFRIKDCTKVSAAVLGTEHPEFCEGKEAAAGNSAELFETELIPAGATGLPLSRLSSIHAHYFGGGFERVVGMKLRAFVTERYDYDEKTGRAKASPKLLNALRKAEARELIKEEKEYQEMVIEQMKADKKRKGEDPGSMMSPEARLERSQREMDVMAGKRPRYASTKLEPDECEEKGGF